MRTLLAPMLALLLVAACAPKAGTQPAGGASDGKAAAKPAAGNAEKTVDELWTEARALKDPKERIKIREKILGMVEDPEARQVVSAELVQDYAETGDVEKMEAAAASISIEENYPGAQVRNAMAYAWAEKGTRLDKARAYILEALNILDHMEAGEGVPPTIDPESNDFKDFVEDNRGYFLDTLGWIDLKAGKPKEAIAVLEEAARRVDHSTIRYHLGEAYVSVGDVPNAIKAFVVAVAIESEDSDKAKAALDKLVSQGKADKSEIEKLVKEAKAAHAAKEAKDKADREEREAKAKAAEIERMKEMKAEVEKNALLFRKEDRTPEFDIASFDGKTTANGTLQKKVTVLDFWATWCGPCRVELPIYQGVFEKYKDKGVEFLAVSVDDSRDEAEEYVKDEEYSFPVAHDEDGALQRSFRINGIPTIVVIGPCGRINWVHRGFNPHIETVLVAQIEQLLSETSQSCEKDPPEK